MLITRRSLLRSLLAAPVVIVTPGLLMPVRAIELPPEPLATLKESGWVSLPTRWTVTVSQRDDGEWQVIGRDGLPHSSVITWHAPGMSSSVSADQIAQIAGASL